MPPSARPVSRQRCRPARVRHCGGPAGARRGRRSGVQLQLQLHVRARAACRLHPQSAVAVWACGAWHSFRALLSPSVRLAHTAHTAQQPRRARDAAITTTDTYLGTRTRRPARSACICRTAAGPRGCTSAWPTGRTRRRRDCACWRCWAGGIWLSSGEDDERLLDCHCLRATHNEASSRPPARPACPPCLPAPFPLPFPFPPSPLLPRPSSRCAVPLHVRVVVLALCCPFFFVFFLFCSSGLPPFPSIPPPPRLARPGPSTPTCLLFCPLRRRPGLCSRSGQGTAPCAVLGLIAGCPLPQMLGPSSLSSQSADSAQGRRTQRLPRSPSLVRLIGQPPPRPHLPFFTPALCRPRLALREQHLVCLAALVRCHLPQRCSLIADMHCVTTRTHSPSHSLLPYDHALPSLSTNSLCPLSFCAPLSHLRLPKKKASLLNT